ncbi:DUF4352 domain-containing protein [Streptomyces sp. NPDC005805]|uniref:DUF4352 domain-containing protein n=1 Tax=Streptomyces sp. NPDC005805 TaxID=3157068 RepID=UPI0033DB6ADA
MSQSTQQYGPGEPGFGPGAGPAPFTPQQPPRNGLGTAALVLGIIGLILGIVPFLFWLGGILGLLALILGLVGLGRTKRGQATNKGVTIAGTVLGGLALIVSAVMGVVTVTAVKDAVDEVNKSIEESAPKKPAPKDKAAGDADKGADAPADTAGDDKGAVDEALEAGDGVVYDDDLTVTVSAPRTYTPSEFAIGHTKGNKSYQVTVEIDNAGKEKFDASLVIAEARAGADGTTAEQIFDEKVGQGFSGTILPGKKATVTYAFDVPSGAKTMTVEVTPGIDYDASQWELKL